MDQWNALLRDLWKVPEVSSTVSSIYIILWVLLGSIILRNVIISTMGEQKAGVTWREEWLGKIESDIWDWWVMGREKPTGRL